MQKISIFLGGVCSVQRGNPLTAQRMYFLRRKTQNVFNLQASFVIHLPVFLASHLVCSHEARLHGIRIHDAELPSHHYPSTPLFSLADLPDTTMPITGVVVRHRPLREGERRSIMAQAYTPLYVANLPIATPTMRQIRAHKGDRGDRPQTGSYETLESNVEGVQTARLQRTS